MNKDVTWRDLLAQIIQNPHQRRLLANSLGVAGNTLVRWSNGVSKPRIENLHRLVASLPADEERLRSLIIKELPDFAESNAIFAQQSAEEISSSLYAEILLLRAITTPERRAWVITERLVSALLEQLDAQQVGMIALFALCTPPLAGKPVRSLHTFLGQIIPQSWQEKLQQSPIYLFGAEALTGYAVQTNRLQSLHNREVSNLPTLDVAGMQSAVACPLNSSTRIAGCLYVASQQVDYFLASQLHLIERYAQLMTLALNEQDFYPFDSIALSVLPPSQEQIPVVQAVHHQLVYGKNGKNNFSERRISQPYGPQFWPMLEQQLLDGGGESV